MRCNYGTKPWNTLCNFYVINYQMKGAKSVNNYRRTKKQEFTVGQSVQGNLREGRPGGGF